MLCWVFPSLAGCQTRFPASPAVVLPGVELISPPNKWKWIQKRLQIPNAISQSSYFSPLSACTVTGKQKKKKKRKLFSHFLLIAAVPDTLMVWSAISCSILGRVMRLYCCIYTSTGGHTNTSMHAYKAKCLLANELSWWQILPFNWLVKGAIRIQCIDHITGGESWGDDFYILWVRVCAS